jgi:hypothetical protein
MSGVWFSAGTGFFSPQPRPHQIYLPPSLLSNGYRELFPRRVNRSEREADHSPPSSAEVNAWSYTSAPQYVFTAWCLIKYRVNFTINLCGYQYLAAVVSWGHFNTHCSVRCYMEICDRSSLQQRSVLKRIDLTMFTCWEIQNLLIPLS